MRFNLAVVQRALLLSIAGGCAVLAGGCCTIEQIQTQALPDATVGQSYTFEMEQNCSDDGGLSEAADWRVDGELPPGISLGRDGRFTGVPITAGTYAVRILLGASDLATFRVVDTRTYELRVNPQ